MLQNASYKSNWGRPQVSRLVQSLQSPAFSRSLARSWGTCVLRSTRSKVRPAFVSLPFGTCLSNAVSVAEWPQDACSDWPSGCPHLLFKTDIAMDRVVLSALECYWEEESAHFLMLRRHHVGRYGYYATGPFASLELARCVKHQTHARHAYCRGFESRLELFFLFLL